jgi:hypothetical protein
VHRTVPGRPHRRQRRPRGVGTEWTEFSRSDDIDAMLAGLRPDATQPADAALLTKIHSAAC